MPREATIHEVKPFELHGVRYYAFLYTFSDDPDRLREARIAHDAIYPDPQPGDTVLIESILNIVSDVSKKP